MWSHGRGKVMTKRGSRFCVPNDRRSKKNKETFGGENGESDRRGDGSSSFIVKKTRISPRLITYKSSESRRLDLTNNGMVNHYLTDVDHGSHCLVRHRTTSLTYKSDQTSEGVETRGYMWGYLRRTKRRGIRTATKFTGTSPGQWLRTKWACILFVCYDNTFLPAPVLLPSFHVAFVQCWKDWCLVFLKKQVRNRKNMKISSKRWGLSF